MFQSVQFVIEQTVLFIVREENIFIPRISEMIEYECKWYKVRQVYYTYHNIGESICTIIEVNLERCNFE